MGSVMYQRNQRPAKFWAFMGKMFASAQIQRDLTTLHDSPDTDEWFLTVDGSTVTSFACLRISGDTGQFCHHWVDPEHRGKDLAKVLTQSRLDRAKALHLKKVQSTALENSLGEFKRLGFSAAGKPRGKYIRMEMML